MPRMPGIQVPKFHSSTINPMPPSDMNRKAKLGFEMIVRSRSSAPSWAWSIDAKPVFNCTCLPLTSTDLPSSSASKPLMSDANKSTIPASSASSEVYALASNTVSSRAVTLRFLSRAMLRIRAAASSFALACNVSLNSSPVSDTTDAAPAFVPLAIANK